MTTPAPYPDFDGTQSCADPAVDPELFFPSAATAVQDTHAAVAVCAGCPFKRPCLAYALTRAVHGVWGGTSSATRAEIRRRHGITPVELQLPTPERTTP